MRRRAIPLRCFTYSERAVDHRGALLDNESQSFFAEARHGVAQKKICMRFGYPHGCILTVRNVAGAGRVQDHELTLRHAVCNHAWEPPQYWRRHLAGVAENVI